MTGRLGGGGRCLRGGGVRSLAVGSKMGWTLAEGFANALAVAAL